MNRLFDGLKVALHNQLFKSLYDKVLNKYIMNKQVEDYIKSKSELLDKLGLPAALNRKQVTDILAIGYMEGLEAGKRIVKDALVEAQVAKPPVATITETKPAPVVAPQVAQQPAPAKPTA